MKSGMLAAEAAFDALTAPAQGRAALDLAPYEAALKDSWVWEERRRCRNIRPGCEPTPPAALLPWLTSMGEMPVWGKSLSGGMHSGGTAGQGLMPSLHNALQPRTPCDMALRGAQLCEGGPVGRDGQCGCGHLPAARVRTLDAAHPVPSPPALLQPERLSCTLRSPGCQQRIAAPL